MKVTLNLTVHRKDRKKEFSIVIKSEGLERPDLVVGKVKGSTPLFSTKKFKV